MYFLGTLLPVATSSSILTSIGSVSTPVFSDIMPYAIVAIGISLALLVVSFLIKSLKGK